MDKYDEKAQAMIGHYPPSLPAPCPEECLRCERVAFTAHAMRESAAEAFEEAAKIIKRHAALCGPDFAKLECGVLEHLENERNKLTTAPPRAAGERNK